MNPTRHLRLRQHVGETAAYLELRNHPHELISGIVAKSIALHEFIENYDGPRLILDFDKDNRAIGIEILYPSESDADSN